MSATTASVQTLPSPIGTSKFEDTACDTPTALKASAAQIHSVHIDNEDSAQAAYVQIFNIAAASVTLGTSVAMDTIFCPAGDKITITFRDITNNSGKNTYSTALSAACTTTPNGSTLLTIKPLVEIVFT